QERTLLLESSPLGFERPLVQREALPIPFLACEGERFESFGLVRWRLPTQRARVLSSPALGQSSLRGSRLRFVPCACLCACGRGPEWRGALPWLQVSARAGCSHCSHYCSHRPADPAWYPDLPRFAELERDRRRGRHRGEH